MADPALDFRESTQESSYLLGNTRFSNLQTVSWPRLSMLLRLYGHEVQVARSGPTALEMASASRPDVVLLDIGLPGMDGYQVVQRLRERPEFKGVMICALTGYTPSDSDRSRHRESGFDHYFVKPVSLEKLSELFQTIPSVPVTH